MFGKILFVIFVFRGVQSHPTGADIDVCRDGGTPKHPIRRPQNDKQVEYHQSQPALSSPYIFAANASDYKPGDLTEVVIDGGKESFKGFFIQARSVETNEWIGSWEEAPNTTIHPECAAVTHADPRDKTRATLLWRAPNSHGRVYFTGTVLKNYSTFWADLIAQAPQEPAQLQYLG